LERYRLIVTAHDILTDPAKRKLYDLYGTGWISQAEQEERFRAAARNWRNQPGNASMNATWEDWERWYEERDGRKKQEPLYMSNRGFVGVIILFMMIGGWGQATRAGSHGSSLIELRDQQHDSIRRNLSWKEAQVSGLSKERRIENFLKQRDGWSSPETGHLPSSQDDIHKRDSSRT
jgi:curved DNA-binding protein CbpA